MQASHAGRPEGSYPRLSRVEPFVHLQAVSQPQSPLGSGLRYLPKVEIPPDLRWVRRNVTAFFDEAH